MKYDVNIVIINPITYKAHRQNFIIDLDYAPDYKDIVNEFFRQWSRPDKFDICYTIGVESMNLHDN